MKLFVLLLTLIAVANGQRWLQGLGIKCWECQNARTNDACLASGKVRQCDYNQGSCQNTIRVNHGRVRITKGCKQTQACRNNQRQNNQRAWLGLQCSIYPQNIVCHCCCESDKCNDKALYCRGNTAQSLLAGFEAGQQQQQQQQQTGNTENQNNNNNGQQYVAPQSQNPCHNGSPCGNGATCVVGDGLTYTCQCTEGFTDSHCNTPVRKADDQQQHLEQQQQQNNNNDNINEHNNEYWRGNSQAGFEAAHRNPCENGRPCGNGGTCVPGEGLKYTCQCPAGWGDANCNTKLKPTSAPDSVNDNNDNAPQPTADLNENPYGSNHGDEGYTGPNRNPCQDGSPCGNGGTCVAGTGYEYSCTCPPGWGDANCNTPLRAAKMTTEATTDATAEATTEATTATKAAVTCDMSALKGGVEGRRSIKCTNPDNHALVPNHPGSICTYLCEDGYEISGVDSITCGGDGQWSGSVPTCAKEEVAQDTPEPEPGTPEPELDTPPGKPCDAMPSPCLNGAECTNVKIFTDWGYSCECTSNWEGDHCEIPKR